MFERTEEFMGGSLQGYATVSPAKLVEIFGKPSEADGYKVSGQYTFVNPDNGEAFTVYDWKSTNLYDDSEDPSPEEFWASTVPYDFHIGGSGNTDIAKVTTALESLGTALLARDTFKALTSADS